MLPVPIFRRKHSSKNAVPKEKQTFHPMSTLHGQAQDSHCKTDDANRQNAALDGKGCFGQVVSTKEVTGMSGWKGGQEQFRKPDERSPEIWSAATQGGKIVVRIYAALREANAREQNSLTINLHCKKGKVPERNCRRETSLKHYISFPFLHKIRGEFILYAECQ